MDEELTVHDENLFGVLTGDKFKFNVKMYKGVWDIDVDPTELFVRSVHGYRVHDWYEDERGGPGICFFMEALTPKGKQLISTQIIISKDELIKALALLVEEEE